MLGNIPDKARSVIDKRAQEMQATVFDSLNYHPDFTNDYYLLNVKGHQVALESSLDTPVQAYNIAVAWQLTEVLQPSLLVNDNQRKRGIRKAGHLVKHTGRFERLDSQLDWYFDGGHNIQAIREMKNMISKQQTDEEPVLILSLMSDKLQKR